MKLLSTSSLCLAGFLCFGIGAMLLPVSATARQTPKQAKAKSVPAAPATIGVSRDLLDKELVIVKHLPWIVDEEFDHLAKTEDYFAGHAQWKYFDKRTVTITPPLKASSIPPSSARGSRRLFPSDPIRLPVEPAQVETRCHGRKELSPPTSEGTKRKPRSADGG